MTGVRIRLLVCALTLAPAVAAAEEGVFTAQLVGGAATMHPETPTLGAALTGSIDYGWNDTLSLITASNLIVHVPYTTLGLGAGVKVIPLQGRWTRLYLLLEPQVLLGWPEGGGDLRTTTAAFGGLGVEYLLLWGFGMAIELTGTVPLAQELDLSGASVGLLAGLFMEL